MFEAYRIRPVVEAQSADNELSFRPFNTLAEAEADCDAYEGRLSAHGASGVEGQRIIWMLYGVHPESVAVRAEQAISDFTSDAAARDLLASILGYVVSPDVNGFVYPKSTEQPANVEGFLATIQVLIPGKRDAKFREEHTADSPAMACDRINSMMRGLRVVGWSHVRTEEGQVFPATLMRYDPAAYEAFS
jgi:hypothetical protein